VTLTGTADVANERAIQAINSILAIFDPLRFRAWADLGLTTAQLRVMFLMRTTPGVTAGALASRLAVTPPTISGIVDRLVKLDLVRREDDESDRRLVRNFLSDKGEAACSMLQRRSHAYLGHVLAAMDAADIEMLVCAIGKFAETNARLLAANPELALIDPGEP
jgi:DNA-binding MarR family transcriptional regulator